MMDNKDFGQELLAEIKMKKLLPRPKWRFILKNVIIWVVGALSLMLGSVAISLIMHMVRFNDFDAFDRVGPGPRQFQMIFFAIPFFWVICLALFTVLVFYNIKKTKNGYRYPAMAIVIGSILSSVALGSLFFQIGLGRLVDDAASKNAPFYDKLINPRMSFWAKVDEGRLAGLVVEQKSDKEFVVANPDKEWKVVLSNDAKSDDYKIIEIGKPARFMGKKTADDSFLADKVLPMEAGRGFFDRMPRHMLPKGKEQIMKNMPSMLEDYPELKKAIGEDLIQNKDKIKERLKNHPQEIERFKSMGVDPEIIKQLE